MSSKSDEGRGHSYLSKNTQFSPFLVPVPIFGQSQTFLTDMGRSRYGASNDVCFVVIRPSVSEISGGSESAPMQVDVFWAPAGNRVNPCLVGYSELRDPLGEGGGVSPPLPSTISEATGTLSKIQLDVLILYLVLQP